MGIADREIGLNNGYSLLEVSELVGLLGSMINKCR